MSCHLAILLIEAVCRFLKSCWRHHLTSAIFVWGLDLVILPLIMYDLKSTNLRVFNLIVSVKMAAILQTTVSNSFCLTEMVVVWFKSHWNLHLVIQCTTRTTRTPAFWGYPPAASWLPIPLSHIGSQVNRRQSQSYKFKEFAKISNFWILKQALHAIHLLKLLDKMCKYEMDPMSIVEDTERTRFCPQTDRRTDGQGETSIPPFQLRWSGGIISKH